jgi:hypothetical protein
MVDSDTAHRLRTEWKKARNMFAAFFTELAEVRKEIGDEALDEWVKKNLFTDGLQTVRNAAYLLGGTDAKREQDWLKRGIAAARSAKREAKATPAHHDNKTETKQDNTRARRAEHIVPPPLPRTKEEMLARRKTGRADNETIALRARVAELEQQLAATHDNETVKRNGEAKPVAKRKGGRPCNGERPMTGYERLKAFRERQRAT